MSCMFESLSLAIRIWLLLLMYGGIHNLQHPGAFCNFHRTEAGGGGGGGGGGRESIYTPLSTHPPQNCYCM